MIAQLFPSSFLSTMVLWAATLAGSRYDRSTFPFLFSFYLPVANAFVVS